MKTSLLPYFPLPLHSLLVLSGMEHLSWSQGWIPALFRLRLEPLARPELWQVAGDMYPHVHGCLLLVSVLRGTEMF